MQDHPEARAATEDMLNRLSPNFSTTQMVILKLVSTGIAQSSKMCVAIGLSIGLSNQQILEATKAALAAYLAGLEASPNLDELNRR